MKRKIKADLSHRRESGELSDFAAFLLDCAPEHIDLKVDCRDARLSRPIAEFIGELKTSSSVIFLLNDGFFRSPWCMGELQAFLERRVASFHGFFIICDGGMKEHDVGVFFDKQEQTLVSHWQNVARRASTDEARNEAQCFSEYLPEMLGILRRLNIPGEHTIREIRGEEIWERIREQRKRVQEDIVPRCGETLAEECRRRLVHLVARSHVFCEELAVDCGVEAEADAADVIATLWNGKTGMADNLSALHRAAAEALKATSRERQDSLKDKIRDILGVSLLGMLDHQTHESVVRPARGVLDMDFLPLAESAPEVAEICFASMQREIKTKFRDPDLMDSSAIPISYS